MVFTVSEMFVLTLVIFFTSFIWCFNFIFLKYTFKQNMTINKIPNKFKIKYYVYLVFFNESTEKSKKAMSRLKKLKSKILGFIFAEYLFGKSGKIENEKKYAMKIKKNKIKW